MDMDQPSLARVDLEDTDLLLAKEATATVLASLVREATVTELAQPRVVRADLEDQQSLAREAVVLALGGMTPKPARPTCLPSQAREDLDQEVVDTEGISGESP